MPGSHVILSKQRECCLDDNSISSPTSNFPFLSKSLKNTGSTKILNVIQPRHVEAASIGPKAIWSAPFIASGEFAPMHRVVQTIPPPFHDFALGCRCAKTASYNPLENGFNKPYGTTDGEDLNQYVPSAEVENRGQVVASGGNDLNIPSSNTDVTHSAQRQRQDKKERQIIRHSDAEENDIRSVEQASLYPEYISTEESPKAKNARTNRTNEQMFMDKDESRKRKVYRVVSQSVVVSKRDVSGQNRKGVRTKKGSTVDQRCRSSILTCQALIPVTYIELALLKKGFLELSLPDYGSENCKVEHTILVPVSKEQLLSIQSGVRRLEPNRQGHVFVVGETWTEGVASSNPLIDTHLRAALVPQRDGLKVFTKDPFHIAKVVIAEAEEAQRSSRLNKDMEKRNVSSYGGRRRLIKRIRDSHGFDAKLIGNGKGRLKHGHKIHKNGAVPSKISCALRIQLFAIAMVAAVYPFITMS